MGLAVTSEDWVSWVAWALGHSFTISFRSTVESSWGHSSWGRKNCGPCFHQPFGCFLSGFQETISVPVCQKVSRSHTQALRWSCIVLKYLSRHLPLYSCNRSSTRLIRVIQSLKNWLESLPVEPLVSFPVCIQGVSVIKKSQGVVGF